jgi:predicted transporter
MTRDSKGMVCIVVTFFISIGAWLAYMTHIEWVIAHMYPVALGYAALMAGVLYAGAKWINK